MRATRRLCGSARVGVCFDIDGVLVRGRHVLPGAKEALAMLTQRRVPFAFITNGGGDLEERKATFLTQTLGTPVRAEQVVLAHTPMQDLVDEYGHQRVMVMGCENEVTVARSYGFQKIVTPQQYWAQHPDLYTFRPPPPPPPPAPACGQDPFSKQAVAAVLVMHDPADWHLELQVCLDLLLGRDPLGPLFGTHTGAPALPCIPIFNSNEDFIFAAAYRHPRLAQGSFLHCLQALYTASGGGLIPVGRYGKPHTVTFDYAMQILQSSRIRESDDTGGDGGGGGGGAGFDQVYMIGDNPAADVRGANAAGAPWRSVLVQSGVHRAGEAHEAHEEVPDVLHAIRTILDRHQL